MNRVFLAVSVIVLSVCVTTHIASATNFKYPEDGFILEVDDRLAVPRQAVVKVFFDHFMKTGCITLIAFGRMLDSISASDYTPPLSAYREKNLGWKSEIHVRLSDGTGDAIDYYLGRKDAKGEIFSVVMPKKLAADFCGMSPDDGLRLIDPANPDHGYIYPIPTK